MNKLASIARGDIPADLVIKSAKIADVYTGTYQHGDVAVSGGLIAGISADTYSGINEYDAEGRVLIPALIDGHIHIEDTMMTPANFAAEAARHGTGTVFADPHEIANVLGTAGIKWMVDNSRGLPVDIFYGAPSCVPASPWESAKEPLGVDALEALFSQGLCTHLGEMMNYPAVISGDPEAWAKISAAKGSALTGHAPGVTGKELCAYISSGVDSDHECTTTTEALEKLSLGMWLMLREGSSFTDLRTLLPIVRDNAFAASRCMAVSDDITARYLVERGHMDHKMRIMMEEHLDPFTALRLVTLNPAEYFMTRDRGAIAPGKKAHFALLNSDTIDDTFTVNEVWHNGKALNSFAAPSVVSTISTKSHAVLPSLDDLSRITPPHGAMINAIAVRPGSPLTDTLNISYSGTNSTLARIVVVERHNGTGRFASGYVHGLGITKGAIASSVAHDAHNFVVAGADDESIITALEALRDMNGGLVCTLGGNVISRLALPIAGLMAELNASDTASALENVEQSAKYLGVNIAHPFMVLSFLCLSVIPSLKITDQGYIDITNGGIIPAIVG